MAASDDDTSDPVSDIELDDDELDSELDQELDAMVAENDDDDEEIVSEDDYKLEDPDEIDEDLELREEDEETPKPRQRKYQTTSRQPKRDARKQNMSYYDGIDEEEFETTPEPDHKMKLASSSKDATRPEDLDPDLILTDEETEYNPANHSRGSERQRKMDLESEFLELSNNKFAKKPKKESEEEIALRKAESARRRLDYKNKQLEEEKRDTLNKLLKRRATKVREVEDDQPESKNLKPRRPIPSHPAFIRYTNNTSSLQGNSTISFNI